MCEGCQRTNVQKRPRFCLAVPAKAHIGALIAKQHGAFCQLVEGGGNREEGRARGPSRGPHGAYWSHIRLGPILHFWSIGLLVQYLASGQMLDFWPETLCGSCSDAKPPKTLFDIGELIQYWTGEAMRGGRKLT